jgi:hypothetical protein
MPLKDEFSLKQYASDEELGTRDALAGTLQDCPIPKDQILSNLGLFLESKNLSRILFMDLLYRKIVDVQGVVMEFGTHWGQNLALFQALRGIYEPFNRHRKLIGFDTFSGFPAVSDQDGDSELMRKGQLALPDGYESYLDRILATHERLYPLSHIKKYEICKGDATEQLPRYLERHPHTIVALAYFDFDLYQPTRECLELIKDRLVKGSVLGFDELNDPDSPGETLAVMETLGLRNVRLKRHPYTSRTSYLVIE